MYIYIEEMGYVFIQNKVDNSCMLFDTASLAENIDDEHYRQIDILEEHNQYISFLSKQNMARTRLYISNDHALDVTSNVFIEDYKKYLEEPTTDFTPIDGATPTTQELLLARTLHKSREDQRQEGHLFECFEKGGISAMEKLISRRDALLEDANSKPITPEWDKYRQHLRDLPAMAVNIPMPIDLDEDGNLVGVEWPVVDAEKKSKE